MCVCSCYVRKICMNLSEWFVIWFSSRPTHKMCTKSYDIFSFIFVYFTPAKFYSMNFRRNVFFILTSNLVSHINKIYVMNNQNVTLQSNVQTHQKWIKQTKCRLILWKNTLFRNCRAMPSIWHMGFQWILHRVWPFIRPHEL